MRVLCLSGQSSQNDKKVTNSPITIQVSHCQWLNKIQLVEMKSTEVPILQTSAPSRREWRDDASFSTGRKKKAKKRKGKKKEKNNSRQEVVRIRRQKHRDNQGFPQSRRVHRKSQSFSRSVTIKLTIIFSSQECAIAFRRWRRFYLSSYNRKCRLVETRKTILSRDERRRSPCRGGGKILRQQSSGKNSPKIHHRAS